MLETTTCLSNLNMLTRSWLTNLPDLETVAEQEVDEAQHQEDVAAAEDDAAAADENIERPRSSNSAVSRTTAKTSFSQEEIAELDPDIMVDVLPNLVAAADQLCTLLLPADPKQRPVVWQEIHIEGSRHREVSLNVFNVVIRCLCVISWLLSEVSLEHLVWPVSR